MRKILSEMKLNEKVGQLNQYLYGWECYDKVNGKIELSEKFKSHVKHFGGVGAIYGLLRADPWSAVNYENGLDLEESKQLIKMVNDFVLDHSRHKILPFIVEEMPHGHQGLNSVCYPVNLATGATFNPELYKQQMKEASVYAESLGINIGLFSGLDICKNAKWGRTEETYGADPYLASQFTRITAKYATEKHFRSCLKHFIAQGDPYIGLNSAAVNIGERELNEIHMPPAKLAVDNDVKIIMAAYNEIDGIPCHANKKLLTDVLRDEWNYNGIVMADGTALNRLLSKNISKSQAGKLGLEAGVDLSLWDEVYLELETAVKDGTVSIELIDRSVLRILELKQEMNLIGSKENVGQVILPSQELNYQTAAESVILQKNIEQFLPIAKDKNVLVIADLIDDLYTFLGDYTSFQKIEDFETLKTALKKIYSDITFIKHEQVNDIVLSDYEKVLVFGGGTATREFGAEFADNGALISNTTHTDSGENVDVVDTELPQIQRETISVLEDNKIEYGFVLIGGRPYALGSIFDSAKAILTSYYNGQQGPQAIADIVAGDYNPNGKNPITLPRYSGYNQFEYNSKQDMRNENFINHPNQVFEFGHGLSYSDIEYENLTFEQVNENRILLTVVVNNCSDIDCIETVQLYVKKENTLITKRRRELIRFNKVNIKAKESKIVTFEISKKDLEIYGNNNAFEFEQGHYTFIIGTGLETFTSNEQYIK